MEMSWPVRTRGNAHRTHRAAIRSTASPVPDPAAGRSCPGSSLVDEAGCRELLAHVVDVEAELARVQPRARRRLLVFAYLRGCRDLRRSRRRHDHDAVVV